MTRAIALDGVPLPPAETEAPPAPKPVRAKARPRREPEPVPCPDVEVTVVDRLGVVMAYGSAPLVAREDRAYVVAEPRTWPLASAGTPETIIYDVPASEGRLAVTDCRIRLAFSFALGSGMTFSMPPGTEVGRWR